MSISAVRSDRGYPRATCICDDCGREEVVPAAHERTRGSEEGRVIEGQVVQKIKARGWTFLKGALRCPKCEAKRRSAARSHLVAVENHEPVGVIPMTLDAVVEPPQLREPTREQKREIMAMLDIAYDTQASRYRGHDTDKTVSEALGNGILPGWVASIREEFFGPDGGNHEIEELAAKIAAVRHEISDLQASILDQSETASRLRDDVAAMQKRLDAIRVAVGPKAGGR